MHSIGDQHRLVEAVIASENKFFIPKNKVGKFIINKVDESSQLQNSGNAIMSLANLFKKRRADEIDEDQSDREISINKIFTVIKIFNSKNTFFSRHIKRIQSSLLFKN